MPKRKQSFKAAVRAEQCDFLRVMIEQFVGADVLRSKVTGHEIEAAFDAIRPALFRAALALALGDAADAGIDAQRAGNASAEVDWLVMWSQINDLLYASHHIGTAAFPKIAKAHGWHSGKLKSWAQTGG